MKNRKNMKIIEIIGWEERIANNPTTTYIQGKPQLNWLIFNHPYNGGFGRLPILLCV